MVGTQHIGTHTSLSLQGSDLSAQKALKASYSTTVDSCSPSATTQHSVKNISVSFASRAFRAPWGSICLLWCVRLADGRDTAAAVAAADEEGCEAT